MFSSFLNPIWADSSLSWNLVENHWPSAGDVDYFASRLKMKCNFQLPVANLMVILSQYFLWME